MNTQTDIIDGEQLTITVQATDIDEWQDHDHVARKITCRDIDGNDIPLTIFHSNDAAEFEWDTDQWYTLQNVTGDIYRGEKQLKSSWDFEIAPLDEPPEEAERTELSPPDTPETSDPAEPSDPGNYLLHFSFGQLDELDVHVYKLTVPGGLDPSDDNIENGAMGFTARAAARYRYRSGAPVYTNGPLKVYAIEELHDELAISGYSVQLEHLGTETLESRSAEDRKPLRALIKQDVKAALRPTYNVTAINSIIEHDSHMTADSGDFTAAREYKCRLQITADGIVICGVNVGFHLQSTFSAAAYVQRGYDIEGVTVEHDPESYEKRATGTVTRLAETGYTDYVETMGSSTADYHRKKGYVDEEQIDQLVDTDPVMADIDYGNWEGLQALELCRIVPTVDQLKHVDEDFHKRFQQAVGMLPDQRYPIVSSFVGSIGETPALSLDPDPRPTNDYYNEIDINTRRPNLRFADDQTASYGSRGLDDNSYGVYQTPDSFDLLLLYPETEQEHVGDFKRTLLQQLHAYGANPTRLEQEAYTLGSEFGYMHIDQDATDFDGVIGIVPDRTWIDKQDSIDDPYPEFKKQFGQQKVPSQMVTLPNLDKEHFLGNIAAGIIAKCGGIPWRIDDVPGGADVFIGLDATYDHETGQHIGASANIVLADGTILASQSVSLQQGETFEIKDIIDILKNLLRVYADSEGSTPNHLLIHRDGQYYLDIDDLVDRLEAASDFFPTFDLVEIRKSGNPRIAEYTGDTFEIASKGVGFVAQNADYAYLTTTGTPELTTRNSPGTPRPIRVIKRHGSTDLETLTRQVYWLSEAHMASVNRSIRLPITIEYADRCADHAHKGYLLNDEMIRGIPYV